MPKNRLLGDSSRRFDAAGVFFGPCPLDGEVDDAPDLGVVLSEEPADAVDWHLPCQHQDQGLEQDREAAARPRPWRLHLPNAVALALDARQLGMDQGPVLKEVQVAPALVLGVVDRAGIPAGWTGKRALRRKSI